MSTGSSRKSSSMPATGWLSSTASTSAASAAGSRLVIDTASIVDLRDGRIVRMQGYMNPADALEAAGLSE